MHAVRVSSARGSGGATQLRGVADQLLEVGRLGIADELDHLGMFLELGHRLRIMPHLAHAVEVGRGPRDEFLLDIRASSSGSETRASGVRTERLGHELRLDPKSRKRVTSLTPAASAMRRVVAPRNPDSAKTAAAASRSFLSLMSGGTAREPSRVVCHHDVWLLEAPQDRRTVDSAAWQGHEAGRRGVKDMSTVRIKQYVLAFNGGRAGG